MKLICKSAYPAAVIIGMICGLILLTPARVQGAVAHATTSAEVINPAMIDTSKMLAAAAAGEAGPSSEKTAAKLAQPEVKAVIVDGVTFLSIDYN
jgi:hypothetical protein